VEQQLSCGQPPLVYVTNGGWGTVAADDGGAGYVVRGLTLGIVKPRQRPPVKIRNLATATAVWIRMQKRPNFLVILIDDLRYDEFGAGGHPYMKTPHVDRLARKARCSSARSTRHRSARPIARRSSPGSTRAATASSTTSRATR
jgi:hypothetical protein